MSIIRGPRPEGNFYILDKKISEDKRLSWASRGLLIYLLGKPNHWQVSVHALVNETKASAKPTGRDATWSLLRELIEAGYCTRHQYRKADGTLGEMDYTISEDSSLHPLTAEPLTAYPGTAEPLTAYPGTAEPLTAYPGTAEPLTAYPGTAEPCTANPTQVSIEKKQVLKEKQGLKSADAPVVAKSDSVDRPEEVSQAVWTDFVSLRKDKRAKLTGTALAGIKREADKAGWTLDAVLTECCTRGWVSFKAEWVAGKPAAMTANRTALSFAQQDELAKRKRWEEMTGQQWPESAPAGECFDAENVTPINPKRISA